MTRAKSAAGHYLGWTPDQRANTGIFACTALLIAIIVAGSL